MKIGIIGSGDVGRRLSDGLIEFGHTVKIGTRDPSQESRSGSPNMEKKKHQQEALQKQPCLVN